MNQILLDEIEIAGGIEANGALNINPREAPFEFNRISSLGNRELPGATNGVSEASISSASS